MTDAFLKDTLDVVLAGSTYRFRIPSIADELKLGFIERNIRKDFETQLVADPSGRAPSGEPEGLDFGTLSAIRAIATFQLLLVSADTPTNWCFSSSSTGKPVVDYRKWPNNKLQEAVTVWLIYNQDLQRFREGGSVVDPSGEKVVESIPNPE